MKKYKKIIIFFIVVAVFFIPFGTRALSLPRLIPECTDCGFNDFVQLLINAYNYGLALLGLVVLFFFIWGGFGFILAAGQTEKIQNSKKIITGAFVGMLIVLTSWLTVNFIVSSFSKEGGYLLFGEVWWGKGTDCHKTYNQVCERYKLEEGCGGVSGSTTDSYVRELQTGLNTLGCNCGEVDGCFGPQTRDCVFNFQINSGIVSDPLGTAGEETWNTLNSGAGTCNAKFDIPMITYDGTYCCIPRSDPNNPLTRCVDVMEEEDCKNLNDDGYLCYTEEGACVSHEECGIGCCVPSNLTVSCYDTADGCLSNELFYPTFCDNSTTTSSVCAWHVCVNGINDCYIQRIMCNGDDETGFIFDSVEEAIYKMNNLDECNYGLCATPTLCLDPETVRCMNCTWTDKFTCQNLAGEFFYNEPIIGEGYIPGTDLYCINLNL